MRGEFQCSLLSVSVCVCVCHTAVLDDGESPVADTVDNSSSAPKYTDSPVFYRGKILVIMAGIQAPK